MVVVTLSFTVVLHIGIQCELTPFSAHLKKVDGVFSEEAPLLIIQIWS